MSEEHATQQPPAAEHEPAPPLSTEDRLKKIEEWIEKYEPRLKAVLGE
jgi:predicted component of type VI protein secretion system